MTFKLTAKQLDAQAVLGSEAMHVMLFGGSRSGKTFLIVRAIVIRAIFAPRSRHTILRYRFNHVKASIIRDTFPKVMALCFPGVAYHIDKTDWFARLDDNGAEIWFGGLDDKERTEKILGQEHATIYINEASQVPWSSVLLAMTRLAQSCSYTINGQTKTLRLKMYYDCNPSSQAHWSYKTFILKRDPDTNKPIASPDNYASMQLNPVDNRDNLPAAYLDTLANMPARMRKRFYDGAFADTTENALWSFEIIDRNRETELPDMRRIIIAVDPSGAGDEDNLSNDEIGIIVAGLGVDGNAYVLEDLTVKAGPAKWGKVATDAFDRHQADLIVGEQNFGGEMVKFVVRTAKPGVPYKKLTASRGKVVRAEPIASLTELGKIRFAGTFGPLEDELQSFTTAGYLGDRSPNRADAFVWAMSELFPGMVKKEKEAKERIPARLNYNGPGAWLG